MFRASSCPSSGATTTAVAASGLLSELGCSSAVVRGRAGCAFSACFIKPNGCCCLMQFPLDVSVCVYITCLLLQLLMMGLRIPEICCAVFNPLNPELNPICYLLALLGAHHFLHVSRIRVKSLTLRRLMSYIWSTHS